MRHCTVTIHGTMPLLQDRFGEQAEASLLQTTRRAQQVPKTPRELAEHGAYRAPDGTLCFPTSAIARLMRDAGSNHKQRGTRKSLRYIVPAGIRMLEEFGQLHDHNGEPLRDFEVDSRSVVNPKVKARVMKYRPRLDDWFMSFSVGVLDHVIDERIAHQLLSEGGEQIGIGSFRPSNGGPFGTFLVTKWEGAAD